MSSVVQVLKQTPLIVLRSDSESHLFKTSSCFAIYKGSPIDWSYIHTIFPELDCDTLRLELFVPNVGPAVLAPSAWVETLTLLASTSRGPPVFQVKDKWSSPSLPLPGYATTTAGSSVGWERGTEDLFSEDGSVCDA